MSTWREGPFWWAGDPCGLTASGLTQSMAQARLRELIIRLSEGSGNA